MEHQAFDIDGPVLLTPKKFGDERGFFSEPGAWFERAEAMGETHGNPKLAPVFRAERDRNMLAIGRRRRAKIDGHIESRPAHHAHQLALRHGARRDRKRLVILNETGVAARNFWPAPADSFLLSPKDRTHPKLNELPAHF